MSWPGAREVQRLGTGLFAVRGVERGAGPGPFVEERPAHEPSAPERSEQSTLERALGRARHSRDRRSESQSLIDLGALHLREGRAKDAMGPLLEATEIAGSIDDPQVLCDAFLELGLSALALQEPINALEAFERALRLALEGGDLFAEKLARDRVALAFSTLGQPGQALSHLDRALALARQLGDRRHEGYLLWYSSIQQADLGRPARAAEFATLAVGIMGSMGNPEGAWYQDHLRRFTGARTIPGSPGFGDDGRGSEIVVAPDLSPRSADPATSGVGILRMAVSATAAMAKFVRSGFQSLPPADHQARLAICGTCEHHTGTRCRLCGCFTRLKAQLNHERCPLGRWPN